jgi:hypothetical protein
MLISLILNNHGSDNECVSIAFFEKCWKKVKKDDNFETIKRNNHHYPPLKYHLFQPKFFCKENIVILEITSLNQ